MATRTASKLKARKPNATWEDIPLPAQALEMLRELAEAVRSRSGSHAAWFFGEGREGKGLAAEALADDLRLDLHRIHLSQVVSKYVGETEKNLRRVFDEAEVGGTVLVFDEADALFGKRTEVKDAHDRYANLEANYAMERIESFRGVAILANDRKEAIDPAFLRRLRFAVDFPWPSEK